MIPDAALKIIKEFEGLSLNAYMCSAKIWTIGYGLTRLGGRPVEEDDELLDEGEASRLLELELEKKFIPSLQKIPGWYQMNVNQQSALISFAFNLGANFYGHPGFNTITTKLKSQQWQYVPDAILLYTYAGGRELPGLVRRRRAEATLWETPVEEGCNGLQEFA